MAISFGKTFDEVQQCFREASIESQLIPKLQAITIIRDVAGKIRLFLEPVSGYLQESDIADLDSLLSQKLASYYGEDIWFQVGEQDGYKALIETIQNERVVAPWDDKTIPRWYILERHIAKQAWTSKNVSRLPWNQDLVDKGYKPAIVSFFSFKGGVGRTSTLVATALTLARYGHRVAVVDLDLEAPGLATIFSSSNFSNPGVIDYLLEKKIQKNDWRLQSHLSSINEQILLGETGETLRLLPAGTVDQDYLEKLARLDFQNLVDGELPDTLQQMLKELESAVRPLDFILMDARAGFHDIGGLAIADLSHAVVIFGTQSRQSWAGLTYVVRHLTNSDPDKRLPLVLVHAMAPALGIPGRRQELEDFRNRAYDIFQKNYYSEDETVPNPNNSDAPFMPIVVPYQDSLRGDIALFANDDSPEESSRLLDLVDIMANTPYRDIADRICILFGRNLEKN